MECGDQLEEVNTMLIHIDFLSFMEAVAEAAPQFIIQINLRCKCPRGTGQSNSNYSSRDIVFEYD